MKEMEKKRRKHKGIRCKKDSMVHEIYDTTIKKVKRKERMRCRKKGMYGSAERRRVRV